MTEPTVRVSGIVLASLMFQHVNSDSDVEGLVFGESRVEQQVTISDSQSDHIHIEEVYNVQKHVSCHGLNTLYSSSGDVNVEVLQEMQENNKQDGVVGWYRQRRNTEQRLTFREKLVHQQLKSLLNNPHLVFLLLTPGGATATGSTHRTDYSAFISRSRSFVNVPVLVSNLGLLEQHAYWKVSAPCSAAGYHLTVKKHGPRFFSPAGLLKEVSEMNKMNESLQAELQKSCRAVAESECAVEALQVEVSALRRRLREEQRRRSSAGEAPAGGAMRPEPRNNSRLLEAVRALLGHAPLLLTQTVDLGARPVPDISMETPEKPDTEATPPPACRKRQRETLLGRERKRRKSKS